MELYQFYIIYLIVIGFITFLVYFVDKLKAKAKSFRISEKFLLTLSLLGGAYGGILAMYTIRHKTKHWYFSCINLIGILIHGAIVFILAQYF